MNKLLSMLLPAASAFAFVACSNPAGPSSPAVSNAAASPYVQHLAKIPSNSLFVAESNRIDVFSNAAGGWAPTTEITDHVGLEPRSMGIDSLGYLYVTNYTDNGVSLYRLFEGGNYVGALTKGIHNPFVVALDSTDSLAVGAYGDPSKRIVRVFPSGASERSYELQGVSGPAALGYDAGDYLFVANADSNTVTEYTPYSDQPEQTFSHGMNVPVAVASAHGLLYVANRDGYNVTNYYFESSGVGSPISTDGLSPVSLAVGNDHLYIAARSFTGPKSVIIDYNLLSSKTTKIVEGIHEPTQVIACSKIYLCVANSDRRVTIYQSDRLVHTIETKSPIWSITTRSPQ